MNHVNLIVKVGAAPIIATTEEGQKGRSIFPVNM